MRLILEYFIAGMIFVSIVSPLLEEIATVIAQGLQVVIGFFKVIVCKQTLTIAEMKADAEKKLGFSSVKTIGFSVDDSGEEE